MDETAGASGDIDRLAAAAEDVRAWLEVVRGGAPFLSSADGRLLVAWLEAGTPVVLIQAAIDRVAARKRARKHRSRLSLVSCKAEVERMRGLVVASGVSLGPPASLPAPGAPTDGFARWVAALGARPGGGPAAAWDQLLTELGAVSMGVGSPDARAQAAVAACRRFHQAVWDQAPEQQDAQRRAAAEQLEPLRSALSPEQFDAAVEELARESVRVRFPQVSAAAVWDSLQP